MAPFDYIDHHLEGLTLFAFYNNVSHTAESLSGSGANWQFAYTPVCQRGLRLLKTDASGTGFCLNYTLEPITGELTLPYDVSGVSANYYHYSGVIQFFVEPGTFLPKTNRPRQKEDIWGGSHANVPNVKPASIPFSIIRYTRSETVLNYVAAKVIIAEWFLLMDPASSKAYEGNLLSDRLFSVDKGNEPFIECELLVEYFGSFDMDGNSGSGVIDWKAFQN